MSKNTFFLTKRIVWYDRYNTVTLKRTAAIATRRQENNGRITLAATIGSECVVLPAKRGVAEHPNFAKQNMCGAAERSGINSIQ
jgi:hypothetical protein